MPPVYPVRKRARIPAGTAVHIKKHEARATSGSGGQFLDLFENRSLPSNQLGMECIRRPRLALELAGYVHHDAGQLPKKPRNLRNGWIGLNEPRTVDTHKMYFLERDAAGDLHDYDRAVAVYRLVDNLDVAGENAERVHDGRMIKLHGGRGSQVSRDRGVKHTIGMGDFVRGLDQLEYRGTLMGNQKRRDTPEPAGQPVFADTTHDGLR